MRRTASAILALSLLLGSPGCAPRPFPLSETPGSTRSAILVSLDALAEQRLRETLPPGAIPTLLEMFESGACAASVTPTFPSVTAAAHAALWTGAYGDVNGISANAQPRLPRDRHALTELGSGYLVAGMRAEPLWITAARAGIPVTAHHVTQAPQPPAYLPVRSSGDDPGTDRRREAAALLRREGVFILNGYNRPLLGDQVITGEVAMPAPATGWRGIEPLPRGLPPLEISWSVRGDSLHALVLGEESYTHMLIATERDASRGVVARVAAVETGPIHDRPLARHFSGSLPLDLNGDPVNLGFRLFSLAPDASSFLLFQSAAMALEGSDPALMERYVREIGGWVGNGALALLRRGAFGTPLSRGGDGSAEAIYLETAEHMTRQFMAGLDWLVVNLPSRLLIDYFPLGDELDHELLGMVDPAVPSHDPAVARRAQHVRARGWALVDLRLRHLRDIADRQGAALFVTGDHGMRASWRVFRPNVALREAGLLGVTGEDAIDLSSTRALSPNGYWISVNTTDWREGIVSESEREDVIHQVERALLLVRDDAGLPIVTATWRADDHPELGLGGPVGGDVYFALAPGFHWSADAAGPVHAPARPEGKHGYPSIEPDMHTAFCMLADGVAPRRTGTVRVIDIAPTVSEWLGIPAPADAVGRSVLRDLTGAPLFDTHTHSMIDRERRNR